MVCTRSPIPSIRSTSRNISNRGSNPTSRNEFQLVENPDSNPIYYPGYLIPTGTSGTTLQTNGEPNTVQYSYAACENLYDDYEDMDGEPSSKQQCEAHAPIDHAKSIYEVEDVSDSEVTEQNISECKTGKAKSTIGTSDDSECHESVPNEEGNQAKIAMREYWTEIQQPSVLESGGDNDDGVSEDYEPVENPSNDQRDGDSDHHDYAECSSEGGGDVTEQNISESKTGKAKSTIGTSDDSECHESVPNEGGNQAKAAMREYWTEIQQPSVLESGGDNDDGVSEDYEPVENPSNDQRDGDSDHHDYAECSSEGGGDVSDNVDDDGYEPMDNPSCSNTRNNDRVEEDAHSYESCDDFTDEENDYEKFEY